MKIFKAITEYLDKHKTFVKKLLLFSVYIIVISLFKNDSVIALFNSLFNSDLAGEAVATVASGIGITALVD